MNLHPRGSRQHALEEARNRSALYRITCYVIRLAQLEEDEQGVYGYYCYDSAKPEDDGSKLIAVYTSGRLTESYPDVR